MKSHNWNDFQKNNGINEKKTMHSGKPLVITLFLTTAAILLASIAFAFWVGNIAVTSTRHLSSITSITHRLDQFLSTLKDAETGQRGYLLTADDKYLAPYNQSVATVRKEMDSLRASAAAGDLPAADVDRLQALTEEKLGELEKTLKLKRDGSTEGAMAIVRSDEGRLFMDGTPDREGVRGLIARLVAHNDARMVDESRHAQSATTLRTTIFILVAIVNVAFLAWAYRRLAQAILQRESAITQRDLQNEWLNVTLASIGDAVIITDLDGKITFINAEAQRLTAWLDNQAIGQPLTDVFKIVNEQTRLPVESPVEKVLRLGTVVGLANHTILLARDGREIPIDDSGAPIRKPGGEMRGVVLVFRDFSEHKAAQGALRESEERFHTMADAMPQLAWMANPDGHIFWYNRRWHEYTGATPAEMEGWGWQKVHDPEILPEVIARWKESLATGQPMEMEFPLRASDGRFRWFLTRVTPFKDNHGRIIRWFGTNTDISEKREVAQTRQRLSAIVESSDDAILSKNVDGIILTWNAGAQRMFGYSAEEIVGQSITLLLPRERVCEEEGILQSLRRGEVIDHFETVQITKDGRRIDVSTTMSPLKDPQGRIIGASKIIRDITERKRAEDAMRAARDSAEAAKSEAEAANRAKDHFLAALSHELRTPLTPVMVVAGILEDDRRLPDEVRQDISMIRRNVALETRLIDDLLDLTRIRRGKVDLELGPVDVATILRQTVEICGPDLDARSLSLTLDADGGPFVMLADSPRLHQIFWNILKNAIKFSPNGAQIDIRCNQVKPLRARIEIRDQGIGMEPEVLSKLFEPFEQGDRKITQQFGGLGLGLNISKALVEMHGGKISASSAGKSKGSTFIIEFPLAERGALPRPNMDISSSPADHGRKQEIGIMRILLVEDHADTAKLMMRLLKGQGHEVQTASNLESALTLVKAHHFDLLVSDLGLPDGTGLDLMRQAKTLHAHLRGIALSGYGTDEDIRRSRSAGFDQHLTKPVNFSRLLEVIAVTANSRPPENGGQS